ncbi:hypothetical protein DVH05_024035 [Phytophthora capsici]|nr:hypothetical protein DVH05_024035 [Phytophthora capsici]
MLLPLHPRRAQQLLQDVLEIDSNLTPQLSSKGLPERLRELQRLNLIGIQAAKRGSEFQLLQTLNSHTEKVKLRLTKDGSTVRILGTNLVSVSLTTIKQILLHPTIPHGFSIRIGEETGENNDDIAPFSLRDIFIAGSAEVLNFWVVALTCGVNAFQQHQLRQSRCFPDVKEADLVWQAVRLRIFELSGVIGMSAAIQKVLRSIPDQDLEQSEALRNRLKFFQCSMID